MRNLKRALSLILAAAMLIGMMVVGAGAVSYNDFPDRDEIVNKDAVSMLTTLGIIEGTDQGTYNPTGNVDRAQMAKMISVALTNNEDCDTLYQNVNSGLTDIAANWARGYINYCYTLGIIAGRGNNTFDPSANVTGVEAAKMLLTALGYDASIEGLVGNDWALNTAALAQNLGIFRNFTKDVSEPLNRDDAALLIYNALDVELIQEYRNGYAISYDDHRTILSSVFGVMRVEGVVVANEWAQLQETDSDAALREGRTTLDNVVVYDSTTSNTVVPEGVREDDPVTFNVATPVEYMGKAVTMYVEKTTILANSKVIGVATDDDANVINFTAESQDTAKDYLKGTGVAVDDNTEYYVNYGYFKDQDAAIDWINENYYDDGGSDFGRNGIEVQVIDNNDDGTAEYVLYLQETLSEVIRYNERNETLSFYAPTRTTRNVLTGKTENVTEDMADVVSAEKVSLNGVTTTDTLSLEAEDLILYVQYGGRTYVANPEIVTGKMTRVDRDKDDELYITIDDGETYYQSYILDAASMVDVDLTHFDIDTAAKDVPGFDTTYDFILDSNGYVVAVRPAEDVVTNYALVLDSAWTQNALTRGGEIKVLMADGTENTFDINWKESAKAFTGIDSIMAADDVKGETNDVKLEYYLGSRDVHDDTGNTGYRTGRAVGSIIEYSLNEAGDELTIERVLQGNTFESDNGLGDTLEIDANTNVKTTAGVADDGNVIFLDGDPDNHDNLQYVAYDGYDNGYGRITVSPSARSDMAGRTESKTYAVDLNTVAFYFFDEDGDGVADSGEYGVATGWDKMSDIDEPTDVQVYPVLEKTANREYKASNLADVILFEAKPDTVADNYMLILSANAVGKDLLELNVVFEDGTVEAIQIDDQGSFDEDDRTDFMMAWTYSENADGTYDIGTPAQYSGTADLLINGTVDLNNGIYLALPSTAAVWDVTEVDSANDTVTTGRFQQNVVVNTVIIVSEGKVRTAWIWDADSTTIGGDFDWNWDTTGFETVYPFSGWGQWQIQQYLFDDKNVRVLGDLTLSDNLYIPEGTILQVEGDLRENGYTVTGDGALRIRDDYYVNNDGKADHTSTVTVNTQVGNDMLLAETTSISSRVGVYGDIVGNTTNNATIAANLIQDLTVDATGNVYVYGDVMVDYLIVNGHIEANHYYINGGEVNSTRTLIARGDVTVYGGGTDPRRGTLTIGDTSAGSATVGGEISGSNLNVNNGTLTLSNTASINMTGNVTVGKNGEIYQNRGIARNLGAANVSISGVVSISGTIVTGTLTLNNTADVTVVGNPVYTTLNGTGSINANMDILPGGSTTTPVAGNWLTSMDVKGVAVSLNQNNKTGSVVLAGDVATANNVRVYGDVVLYNTAYNYVVTLNGAAVADNANTALKNGDIIRVTITNAANEQQTYVITVTVASASYTVSFTENSNMTPTVENAQKVGSTNYVLANDAVVFTVKPAAGYSVTGVSYTVGGQGNYTLDVNAENRYTIPASHVTGDIVITVTTDETPVPANVTLTEKTGVSLAFELDGSGDSYTLTVPADYSITNDTITNLVTVDGTGKDTGSWKLENDTFTRTFTGNQADSTADDQTVTVKVVKVTPEQALERDKAAIREALAETLEATASGTKETDAESAVKTAVETAIKIQGWSKSGEMIALADQNGVVVNFSGDWTAPAANDSRTDTFDVTITLKDVKEPITLTVTVKVAY